MERVVPPGRDAPGIAWLVDHPVDTNAIENLKLAFNGYYFKITDAIQVIDDASTGLISDNVGEVTGRGFELAASWRASANYSLSGSFAHQYTIDERGNAPAGELPREHFKLRSDWRLTARISNQVRVNWVLDRARAAAVNDTRAKMDGYAIVDVVVNYHTLADKFYLTPSALNVFDEDAREPSAVSSAGAQIPGDFPVPGRAVLVGVKGVF